MLTVIWRNSRNLKKVYKKYHHVRYLSSAHPKLTENDVEEIKIPVPWGHIAGKWWGNKNVPPVLAIHGWEDNANSFDRLLPLLNLSSVLAIDLPGHGCSSHFPTGKIYEFGEYLLMLHRIKEHFNWKSMPLLTHSFGSALGFVYSSVFPSAVTYLINIECARALLTIFKADLSVAMSQGIDNSLKIEEQKKTKSPPAYKLSELVSMSIEGSFGSLTTPESALVLLKRGTYLADKPPMFKKTERVSFESDLADFMKYEKMLAKSLPPEEQESVYKHYLTIFESLDKIRTKIKDFHLNEADDKYYIFSRDPLLKVQAFLSYDEEFITEASKNIKCPVLSLKANNGFLNGTTRKLYYETLENLKTSSSYLEHHEVDGTHHLHLNTPELLAPLINKFLQNIKFASPAELKLSA